MDPVKFSSKTLVYSTMTALVISLLFVGMTLNQKNNLSEELSAEKLQTFSLTQSRELLQLDLVELESMIGSLSKSKVEAENKTLFLEEKIALLETDNLEIIEKNKHLNGKSNKQKLLENELKELRISNDKENSILRIENDKLQSIISSLDKEKQGLIAQLNSRKTVVAEYFRIEALKKKGNKQSRKASKTRRILVSFSWNEALTKEFTNSPVYLMLTGLGSSKLPSTAIEKVLISMDKQSIEIPVVAKAKIQSINKGRQEIIMTTQSKLSPGIYQADVYTDKFHLGGAQIKLD